MTKNGVPYEVKKFFHGRDIHQTFRKVPPCHKINFDTIHKSGFQPWAELGLDRDQYFRVLLVKNQKKFFYANCTGPILMFNTLKEAHFNALSYAPTHGSGFHPGAE